MPTDTIIAMTAIHSLRSITDLCSLYTEHYTHTSLNAKLDDIMRKIVASEFMTIDGVIQNEEADGDGFKYGGWFFPYADEVTGAVVQERLAKPMDLLLGRKTFAAWETYWPTHSNFWPNVMTATKYVASNTRDSSDWQPNVFLSGDIAEKVREGTHHRVTETQRF